MFSRVYSGDISGVDAHMVCVEADISGGLPQFCMVGLLSSEVKEARERVIRAFANSGFDLPARKITVNLSPAGVRKQGSGFDIPIAVSILAALGRIDPEKVSGMMFSGELSLDGKINPVKGILPMALMAKKEGFRILVVPRENAFEGAVIDGICICGVSSLKELVESLNQNSLVPSEHIDLEEQLRQAYYEDILDFSDIYGQEHAKRATEVAVAGFHNLLYIGPPGSGKSMLARRIPSILSRLTKEESLEISKIYSIMGLLPENSLILTRPFRAPHHSITAPALIGGMGNPRPGEITLAHKGVLFLDEAAEFRKSVIETLRQPLEDKQVVISRLAGNVVFPADFMMVMAMNPCKCGYYPDKQHCRCSQAEVDRYYGKIRGPILDRIDICVGTTKLAISDLENISMKEQDGRNNRKVPDGPVMDSEGMRKRVLQAQQIQKERFTGTGISFNSQMTGKEISRFCRLGGESKRILDRAYTKYNMSARGYYKILKVARTIADLAGKKDISREHIMEAIGYRNTHEQ